MVLSHLPRVQNRRDLDPWVARFLQSIVKRCRAHLQERRGSMRRVDMSEEKLRKTRLVAYWLFSATAVVFAAVTAYIALWTRPLGATTSTVIKAGLPVWGITAVAACVVFGGYTIYLRRQSE